MIFCICIKSLSNKQYILAITHTGERIIIKTADKAKFFDIKKGTTRIVFLIGKYAIKFPYWRLFKPRAYRNFLNGILGNLSEVEFGTCNAPELAPVLFYVWGGFMVVMPRTTPLTREEWESFDFDKHFKLFHSDLSERKPDSFGKLNNKIVAVDYGN